MGLTSSKAPPVEIGPDNIQTPPWAAERSQNNPTVFFDMSADGKPLGRIEMKLTADVAPRT